MAVVLTTSLLMLGASSLTDASAADGPNLAAGRPTAAGSAHAEYAARNITDGDQGTYWQSAGGDLPQWVQTDLGSTAVTGYDVYADDEPLTSVAGNATTCTDTRPASATVSYFVRAEDAAGNVSGVSNTVRPARGRRSGRSPSTDCA